MDWFAQHGVWTLAVLLFVAGLGIPSPASIGVLAAGTLVRDGRMDPISAVALAVAGATLGQLGSYWIGRKGLRGVFKKMTQKRGWKKAHDKYTKHRNGTIFLSRWLVSPLAMPVNLIAGMEKHPWWSFAGLALLGNLVWVLLYGGVGYTVGAAWGRLDRAAHWIEYFGGAVVVIGIVWWGIKRHRKNHQTAELGSA